MKRPHRKLSPMDAYPVVIPCLENLSETHYMYWDGFTMFVTILEGVNEDGLLTYLLAPICNERDSIVNVAFICTMTA